MKKIYILTISLFLNFHLSPQGWVQTASTPQGSGVTDMLLKKSNGFLYVTTGSFNWPQEPGGVRVSTDGGNTWQNQTFSFVARTIIEGPDGNLYASIWPDPNLFAADGLYRSANNGVTWSPLGFVQAGDNIFSIAVSPTTPTQTIFAGTRNGVIRSTNNGSTFQNTSNGIPPNSWVRDIAVDSSGIVAAATTNGVFISTNNGEVWQQAAGINDTIVKLIFSYPLSNQESFSEVKLIGGSENGQLHESIRSAEYLFFTLMALFDPDKEVSGLYALLLGTLNKIEHGVTTFSKGTKSEKPPDQQGGGFLISTDNGKNWTSFNDGLPQNPKISALTVNLKSGSPEVINYFIGFFENTIGGAKIYKRETLVSVEQINNLTPNSFSLSQNYPNPFNPSTNIQFELPQESFVSLEIFNTIGEKVETLVSENLKSGVYNYEWNADRFTSGVYFYRLLTENFSSVKKLVLLK